MDDGLERHPELVERAGEALVERRLLRVVADVCGFLEEWRFIRTI
jgi:hypothetical protein